VSAPLAVLVSRATEPFLELMRAALTTDWELATAPDDPGTAEALMARAEAVVTVRFGRDWPPTPKLRLVQVCGAGYDGVDLAALPRKVALCNVFEHDAGVAEYALLAMLEWCHRLATADRDLRRGIWARSSRFGGAPDEEIAGKTLLIVGLGRIGRAVARRARACDMTVLAVNRTAGVIDPHVEAVGGLDALNALLPRADFVVLACALAPETRGLIGAAAFAAMKPGAVVINVARGPVIDEAALDAALALGRIGGAVIDTWWDYPVDAAPRAPSTGFAFHERPSVIISPHVAGWTTGTVRRRAVAMAANLDRLARGEPLANLIDRPSQ
jgi:phosphoglycerate dehydrogenase-like enzyme